MTRFAVGCVLLGCLHVVFALLACVCCFRGFGCGVDCCELFVACWFGCCFGCVVWWCCASSGCGDLLWWFGLCCVQVCTLWFGLLFVSLFV